MIHKLKIVQKQQSEKLDGQCERINFDTNKIMMNQISHETFTNYDQHFTTMMWLSCCLTKF